MKERVAVGGCFRGIGDADFASGDPVVLVGLTQFGLVVSPSLPVNSVQDLIVLAKANRSQHLWRLSRST